MIPEGDYTDEIEAEFRKIGFTGAAIYFPLSPAAIAVRRRISGIPDGMVMPWTWDYAPNAWVRDDLERQAAEAELRERIE